MRGSYDPLNNELHRILSLGLIPPRYWPLPAER
jgi:hypothetical protein